MARSQLEIPHFGRLTPRPTRGADIHWTARCLIRMMDRSGVEGRCVLALGEAINVVGFRPFLGVR